VNHIARIWDSDIAWSFRHSPVAMVAALVALSIIFSALFAPVIAPHDPFNPATLNLMDGFSRPMEANSISGNVYLLGTDNQGRDIFSAIMYGARISLFVGFSAVLFAMTLGTAFGLIAGWRGGWVDSALMRLADVQLSFPSILIALLIFGIARGFIPPTMREDVAIWVLIISIGLSDWVQFARVVRGATLVEKSKEYVQAARVIGVHPVRIVTGHILPNVMGPVLVIATISLALAIIAEATLSFLGVGVPPTQPSLGTLIRIGQGYLFSGEWWILFFPATALLALALSVNLLGDWLRDALNPKLR
jgi:peptide/nickel transport system permease protein